MAAVWAWATVSTPASWPWQTAAMRQSSACGCALPTIRRWAWFGTRMLGMRRRAMSLANGGWTCPACDEDRPAHHVHRAARYHRGRWAEARCGDAYPLDCARRRHSDHQWPLLLDRREIRVARHIRA